MKTWMTREDFTIVDEELTSNPTIHVHADVIHTVTDDGQLSIELTNIDYDVWGNC